MVTGAVVGTHCAELFTCDEDIFGPDGSRMHFLLSNLDEKSRKEKESCFACATHTHTHTDIQLKVSFKSWTAAFVPEVVQKTPIHISHKQMKAHRSISISLAILRPVIFLFFTDKHTSKPDFQGLSRACDCF